MPPVAELLVSATRHYVAGQVGVAEELLRQILAVEPRHARALHLLGSIACQRGRAQAATEHFRAALGVEPDNPLFHSSLGVAYQALHRPDDAIACHKRALEQDPGFAMAVDSLAFTLVSLGQKEEAVAVLQQGLQANPDNAELLNNLGLALATLERFEEAIPYYRRAVELKPDFAKAHHNLGKALQSCGQAEEALNSYRRAVQFLPRFAQAHKNMGHALQKLGRLDEAVHAYRQALQLNPQLLNIHTALGYTLLRKNALADAHVCFEQALKLNPDDADALNGLGNAYHRCGHLEQSEECYRRACELTPDWSTPHYGLAVTLQRQGCVAEALERYRDAVRLQPDDHVAHSNLLGTLIYDPNVPARVLLERHRAWAERHARPQGEPPVHANSPEPDRRLRIGYVSPDLRGHAVAFFLKPILYHHDPEGFEIFCYSDVAEADSETAYLRTLPQNWRDTHGMKDDEWIDLVRRDQVDVLVEMAGHTADNRLRALARRPAPVQVTYLGYPTTTGLSAIDYRLVDAVTDPPGEPNCHTEELVRLEPIFCCYSPPLNVSRPRQPPVLATGSITFGSLHRFEKLNGDVLQLWARVLRGVAGSRLLVARGNIGEKVEQRLRAEFGRHGVAGERVVFQRVDHLRMQHLRAYHQIDIALDPFPWNGHTTACEALWMGVPVVALRGDRHSARMVASVHDCLGLTELIAETPEDYYRIAIALAGDLAQLSEYRRHLRTRLFESRLCDGESFTRGLEAAYRKMWHKWCHQRTGRMARA